MTTINLGDVRLLVSKNELAAGTFSDTFTVMSEALATALAVTSIGGGTTLAINVYTSTALGQEVKVISYPSVTAITNDLALGRADFVFQTCRIEAIWDGPITFEVRGRGASAAAVASGGGGGGGGVITSVSDTNSVDMILTGPVLAAEVKLNGSTLESTPTGIRVAALGISNAQISASANIDASKIGTVTIPSEIYGLPMGGDSLGTILAKLVWTQALHKNRISQDITIPDGYTLLRSSVELDNTVTLRLESGSTLRLI